MTTSGTVGAALTGAYALLRGETLSPQLDAELLLASVLKQPRAYVIAHRSDPLPAPLARAFTSLVNRRREGVPLPYLTGRTEFYGREFVVTPAVMVPRPESEGIVEEAVRLLGEIPSFKSQAPNNDSSSKFRNPIVADIGTGSGVLAVTIAAEVPRARVVATDGSASALVVARRNARKHKVARRMTFIKSDLLTEIPLELAPTMIVANLPYVPTDDLKHADEKLETRGLAWEPKTALDGGPDGLFVIRRFFAQLKRMPEVTHRLEHLVLEHPPAQRRPAPRSLGGVGRILELAHDALPDFTPHEVTPFVTSWTRVLRE